MEKHSISTITLAGFQWMFFMFANTVVIPLSIGTVLQLSQQEISVAIQYSFIVTGVACILQSLIGHRYSLMEGQAGLWWAIILSISTSSLAIGMELSVIGGSLAAGIILSGFITTLIGVLGLGDQLKKIFNQVVMSVVLFLLSSQLIFVFLQGMIGLYDGDEIILPLAGLSVVIALFVGWLQLNFKGLISNFSILIGIIVGWIGYSFLFETEQLTLSTFQGISYFPWGTPSWEVGIIVTCIIAGLINTTNTIVSLKEAEQLYHTNTTKQQYKRSFILSGFFTSISGIIGLVPYAPYISSIGFLQSTKILERSAIILGGFFFMLLGFVPLFSALFSTLPISVGCAVLLVAYFPLFRSAMRNLEGIHFNAKTNFRIAVPVLLGLAIMNLPAEVFNSFPHTVRPLISNGLLMGILISIVLEHTVNWSKYEDREDAAGTDSRVGKSRDL
ncbi:uracil/xanthine transporter [Bacillus sp. B15-48]|uniref:uracil/xanthine transporter n=1 Tax=Bacillus sp. B15-48 TaxID=1548601 RepID=UPI001EF3A510|nr:uracil/xanthine transporter [Bacillus sp. B15-48]